MATFLRLSSAFKFSDVVAHCVIPLVSVRISLFSCWQRKRMSSRWRPAKRWWRKRTGLRRCWRARRRCTGRSCRWTWWVEERRHLCSRSQRHSLVPRCCPSSPLSTYNTPRPFVDSCNDNFNRVFGLWKIYN